MTPFESLETEAMRKALDEASGLIAIQEAVNIANSYQKTIEALANGNAIQLAMNAANSYQKTIEELASGDAIKRAMNLANSYQKTMKALANGDAIQRAISIASSYQHTMEALASGDAIKRAMNLANSYQKTMKALANGDAIQRAISIASSHQQSIAEIINNSSFKNAIDALAEPSNLLATLDAIARAEKDTFAGELSEPELANEELERQLREIGISKDSDSFVKAFSKLSPAVKAILLFFILQLLAVSQNIVANIVTPHVEKLISDPGITEREKIKQLKAFSFDELDLSNLRFVTTERLILRESPSSNSEIKDELWLGKVVSVVEKHRNWMEISYEDKNGEIMKGWVFSRYTAKFKK